MKILDTDHWVAVLRGTLNLNNHTNAQEELAIAAISVGELVYGVERSADPQRRWLELNAMLANIRVLPYDDDAACRFAILKVYLERRGERLDDADLQITSIALSSSAPLVTHNTRHFNRVPNLLLEDWLI